MKLSIVILSYNTSKLLSQTLASIPHSNQYEVIVVDNHSSDNSTTMVKSDYPKVKLIESGRNLGFAAGNNLGLKIARGEYIMLLNSDAQIIGDALSLLLQYMDNHPLVGAITPKVILSDGSIDLACHRGMPTPWNSLTYFAGLEKLFPKSKLFAGYHQTYLNFDSTHQIQATAATAMIIRREVVNRIGLLDEQFFMYAEDLDYCLRINQLGYSIIYLPQAQVLHLKSQSGKNSRDIKTKQITQHHFYETMKQFYEKHYHNKYPKWLKIIMYKYIDYKKSK